MAIRRPKTNKNPPIFSHEFIIINHADILSFIAMIFIVGLLFQISNPIASPFVMLQHNITNNDTSVPIQYNAGLSDMFTISFYFLLSIIIHAVIQEYILDKQNKRLRLSKVKHSKFNESGQLLFFYVSSAVAAFYIISNEHYLTNISSLWTSYPHLEMSYLMKYYFIAQLSYWMHFYPELYFQKVKRDEILPRITYITLHLVFIAAAYTLSLQRLTIVLLALHYTTESMFHFSRLIYFSEKQPVANIGFSVWNVSYVAVRLLSITLATLTLWYGLGQIGEDGKSAMCNVKRMCSLGAICFTQAWLMWHFIKFHLRRRHVSERPKVATSNSQKMTRSVTKSEEMTSPMTRSRTKKLQ